MAASSHGQPAGLSSRTPAAGTFSPGPADALLVVDMQNGFLPGGALAVAGGDEIIPAINGLIGKFQTVVLTQDWHPQDHLSFATQHVGRRPFDTVTLSYGTQVLWPDHCIQGTYDARIADAIDGNRAHLILRKGHHRAIDSYSAFIEADRKTSTGLAGYLKDRGIRNVYLCGLATDFCVAWSALDARTLGFGTWVIEDATRGIDLDGSLETAWRQMADADVRRISSEQIAQRPTPAACAC